MGVHDGRRGDELDALVADSAAVEVVEEALTAAEQYWHDRDVHLVDQAGAEVLLDGCHPAAESDVLTVRCVERLLERRFDVVVDEVEGRPALPR